MRAEAARYCATQPGLRYLAFDFHHECSKGRYTRISLLWDKVCVRGCDCNRGHSIAMLLHAAITLYKIPSVDVQAQHAVLCDSLLVL